MDVVPDSHIARLVLGYLYDEKLDNVSKVFCKYSPHLNEEYEIIKEGRRPCSIDNDYLSTIVREHRYITSKVNELISIFPENISAAFDGKTRFEKIDHLLEIVRETMGTSEDDNTLKRTRSEAMSSQLSDISSCSTEVFYPPERSRSANPYKNVSNEFSQVVYPPKRSRSANPYKNVSNEFSEDSESEEDNGTNAEVKILENEMEENSAHLSKSSESENGDAINSKPMVENKKATIIDNIKEPLDSSTPLFKTKITHRNKLNKKQKVARNKLSHENKNKENLEKRSALEIDKNFANYLSHIDLNRTLKPRVFKEKFASDLSHIGSTRTLRPRVIKEKFASDLSHIGSTRTLRPRVIKKKNKKIQ